MSEKQPTELDKILNKVIGQCSMRFPSNVIWQFQQVANDLKKDFAEFDESNYGIIDKIIESYNARVAK